MALPGEHAYLEEPPSGSAQKDGSVIVSTGHSHGREPWSSEHRRCPQRLQDGQWMLQVGRSAIQLLRLQLRRRGRLDSALEPSLAPCLFTQADLSSQTSTDPSKGLAE